MQEGLKGKLARGLQGYKHVYLIMDEPRDGAVKCTNLYTRQETFIPLEELLNKDMYRIQNKSEVGKTGYNVRIKNLFVYKAYYGKRIEFFLPTTINYVLTGNGNCTKKGIPEKVGMVMFAIDFDSESADNLCNTMRLYSRDIDKKLNANPIGFLEGYKDGSIAYFGNEKNFPFKIPNCKSGEELIKIIDKLKDRWGKYETFKWKLLEANLGIPDNSRAIARNFNKLLEELFDGCIWSDLKIIPEATTCILRTYKSFNVNRLRNLREAFEYKYDIHVSIKNCWDKGENIYEVRFM